MTTLTEEQLITEPGVYEFIPADMYHADPVAGGSLSSSGARTLLQPGGPARFKYAIDNPRAGETTDALDFGRAAHQVVLGDYENHIAVINAPDWRTKKAQVAAEDARDHGLTPILTKQWEVIQEMAAAIQAHPTAAALLRAGKPEQTIIWKDQDSGIMCRARIDWLRSPIPGKRLILTDYKTCESADPESFGKSSANYGYMLQDVFYSSGVQTLGLDTDPAFLFVAQEKKPPYLVNVIQLDDTARNLGRNFMRGAINTYIECKRSNHWPGYGNEVQLASLPAWYLRQYGEEPE